MTTHVLVPIDGSEQSWTAFEHAMETFQGERITALHVVDPMTGIYAGVDGDFYDAGAYDRAYDRGEELGDEAKRRLENRGLLDSTVFESAIETGRPARAILEYVAEHGVDHVVMGSHGRSGVARILLGSVAESVTRRATVPVTVVR
jgi:nucleotide-binding universal stress UspA family protein